MHRDAGAVIVGEAGIGKSHAARAVARRLRTRGIAVEFVLATEAASTVPFGALAGLLDCAPEGAGDLLNVLRTTGHRLASRGPLALIVDDAHRLDPASAALLLQLVTRHRVRVLATVRANSRAPDAVTSLWKDAGLVRVDLQPLTNDAAGDVARDLLGGPVERDTQRWLNATSAGNPLFLRELVRSGLDEGAFACEQGHWRRTRPIPPPRRLLDLLDERIEQLTRAQRRALALVVLAEPISFDLLTRLNASEPARALESRGLLAAIDTVGGTRLGVGHPLYGEALRASLKATETRGLHAELAAQLDPDDEQDRLRLAIWSVEDGQPDDTALLVLGAQTALEAFDPELAIRLGQAAVAASPGLEAALPLAVALREVGRFAEAEEQLAALEPAARGSARATSYLFVRATNLSWSLGRPDDAQALLGRVDVEPGATVVDAALRSSEGKLHEGVSRAQRVLVHSGTDRLALAIAAVLVGHDLAVLGQPRAALEALDAAERAGVESDWPRAAVATVGAFYAAERWTERQQALRRRHAAARAAGDDARAALCEVAYLRLGVALGELEDSRRHAEDALARLAFTDPRAMAPAAYAGIAEVHALVGRPEAARAALDRGYQILDRAAVHPVARDSLHLAQALVLAAEGDLPGAQAVALSAADRTGEAILVEAEMLHLFMRVGGTPGEVAGRLREIADGTDCALAELWAHQASAARDGDGPGLTAIAEKFARLGARIFAAEAAAQAALAFESRLAADARRRAEASAARLVSACGANGVALVTTMRLSALTAREQETARLVARGLSNAEIAERLSLSVRTIESHIYRATTKLGVHDRSSLAAALGNPEAELAAAVSD
jgi:DNA-binding CsgD family transcriptional regulator